MRYRDRVHEIFAACNISTGMKGVMYIADAIEYIDVDNCHDIVMEEVYTELSQKYHTTITKVQQNMRYAFIKAMKSENKEMVKKYFTAPLKGNRSLLYHIYFELKREKVQKNG